MGKKIYLANSYGFSTQQRQILLPPIIAELERLDLEVYEPFERNNDAASPYDIAQQDKQDVLDTDAIFAIVNGMPPDEGVAVELGIAIALNKPTFLFRDDYRGVSDNKEYPLNLMLFAGLPRDNWHDYYYTDLIQLTDPNKALAKWAKEKREFIGFRRDDGSIRLICRDDSTDKSVSCEITPFRSRRLLDLSSNGFGWGNEDDTKSFQLALAILLEVTNDEKLALRHYRAFKKRIVSSLPHDGFALQYNDISTWVRLKERNYQEHLIGRFVTATELDERDLDVEYIN